MKTPFIICFLSITTTKTLRLFQEPLVKRRFSSENSSFNVSVYVMAIIKILQNLPFLLQNLNFWVQLFCAEFQKTQCSGPTSLTYQIALLENYRLQLFSLDRHIELESSSACRNKCRIKTYKLFLTLRSLHFSELLQRQLEHVRFHHRRRQYY